MGNKVDLSHIRAVKMEKHSQAAETNGSQEMRRMVHAHQIHCNGGCLTIVWLVVFVSRSILWRAPFEKDKKAAPNFCFLIDHSLRWQQVRSCQSIPWARELFFSIRSTLDLTVDLASDSNTDHRHRWHLASLRMRTTCTATLSLRGREIRRLLQILVKQVTDLSPTGTFEDFKEDYRFLAKT